MSKTLVILGTNRADSHTLQGIRNDLPFNDYQLIELRDFRIDHYSYELPKPADDFLMVVNLMLEAENLVFATPVYWYAMSGRMKVFLDRFTDLITSDKSLGRALAGKSVFLFASGSDEELPEGFEVPFRNTAAFFKMDFKQTYYQVFKN